MKYASKEHQRFYEEQGELFPKDCYYRPLLYLIGLTDTTRDHFPELFNRSSGGIQPESIAYSWQTGTSTRLTRLAFNLFNGLSCEWDEESGEERNASGFAVDNIFCCELAPYFAEAIRLRYPEYY